MTDRKLPTTPPVPEFVERLLREQYGRFENPDTEASVHTQALAFLRAVLREVGRQGEIAEILLVQWAEADEEDGG